MREVILLSTILVGGLIVLCLFPQTHDGPRTVEVGHMLVAGQR